MEHDDELAMLVGILVKSAQTLLKNQRGQFFPFAAVINASGNPEMFGADPGPERQSSTEIIEFLRGAFRVLAEQSKIKACGICVNVGARLPGYGDKVDAICCFIERASQQPIDFYVPFHEGFLGRFKYDQPVALPGTSVVFAATGGIA